MPRAATLKKICDYFGVTAEYLSDNPPEKAIFLAEPTVPYGSSPAELMDIIRSQKEMIETFCRNRITFRNYL
jgi:hypothetical protein